ncbi:MAG: leucyl aminopeptidase [Nocardioidaceae bacterium]
MTAISLRSADPTGVRTDALIIAVARNGGQVQPMGPGQQVAAALGRSFQAGLTGLGFSGKQGEIAKIPTGGVLKAPLVIAVGVGDGDPVSAEALRRAAGAGVRAVSNAKTVALALPSHDDQEVQAICEGALLGSYRFDVYRSGASAEQVSEAVVITDRNRGRGAKQALATAEVVSQAVLRTRDWVNTPARDLTPQAFAEAVTNVGGKVDVEVWDEKRLATERCGGILGVGQGSANPPRLLQLSYRPRKAVTHIALVGKGITYDSGGLSLKTHAGLMTMKCDMAGAAAVVCATHAIAELGLPVRVSCLAAMAENMPGPTATRPGDVIRIRNGTTVEVLNTDAEGRLVLADALVLAAEAEPDLIVDVATLTGACVVALGGRTGGVMSNDDALRDALPAAAKRAGEALWPLPIPEEMKGKVTSSTVADLRQHNPDTSGGALFAAAFLREFVGDSRWAHLDIAGPAFHDDEPYGYVAKGGTGVGVRTLIRFAQDLTTAS